uniref:Uncharacterized protein n=1 Tax=Rhodnius prolixus TaxID=13249 RepID=T1HST6_RHOPR
MATQSTTSFPVQVCYRLILRVDFLLWGLVFVRAAGTKNKERERGANERRGEKEKEKKKWQRKKRNCYFKTPRIVGYIL